MLRTNFYNFRSNWKWKTHTQTGIFKTNLVIVVWWLNRIKSNQIQARDSSGSEIITSEQCCRTLLFRRLLLVVWYRSILWFGSCCGWCELMLDYGFLKVASCCLFLSLRDRNHNPFRHCYYYIFIIIFLFSSVNNSLPAPTTTFAISNNTRSVSAKNWPGQE